MATLLSKHFVNFQNIQNEYLVHAQRVFWPVYVLGGAALLHPQVQVIMTMYFIHCICYAGSRVCPGELIPTLNIWHPIKTKYPSKLKTSHRVSVKEELISKLALFWKLSVRKSLHNSLWLRETLELISSSRKNHG